MASFDCIGVISNIKYLPTSVIVYVDEYHKGFKKSDGTKVQDKYVTFKTIWKPYFKKYISEHFNNGMLVQVKGDVLPYAIDQDKMVDGITIIGQCLNMFSYPRASMKQEIRMMKDSQDMSDEIPNIDDFNQPDF